jgi:hypothetical protein
MREKKKRKEKKKGWRRNTEDKGRVGNAEKKEGIRKKGKQRMVG